jgi:hypothetical protein
MPRYLMHHRHEPAECGATFAAWMGFDSPLRRHPAVGTCLQGGHAIWWDVEAVDVHEALALLPRYVAERTTVVAVTEVPIP